MTNKVLEDSSVTVQMKCVKCGKYWRKIRMTDAPVPTGYRQRFVCPDCLAWTPNPHKIKFLPRYI